MERKLFLRAKKELVHHAELKTRDESRQAVFGYIHGFYNTKWI